ncbi:MAG TPA: DUF2207 domain-containing protein [Sphingomonas sp.]|nr:DUF2207 domain-containing protein [Sphingomonas sp.]
MAHLVRSFVALAWSTAAAAQSAEGSAGAGGAVAEERILNFSSDVTIARDGELDVTETIRLVSLGQEIRRGIQRDFPTSYRNAIGQRTRVTFHVTSVARDGQAEPYELISQFNGTRIRIGRADTLLPPGEHVYAIRYRTGRQILYGAKQDRLYWNVTGSGWTFPIDVAEARITLPTPATFGDRAVYTGAQGATDHDADVISEAPGTIMFRTTKPLPRENGLTIAVDFPKGVLAPVTAGQRLGWWLMDWGTLAGGVAALLLIVTYYVRAWWLVGRGPRAGTIVPLFVPPEGLSAAATRYVWKMASDNDGFSAAIVDLAVAGHVHIRKEGDGWFSRGTTTLEKVASGKPVRAAEAAMLAALFAESDTIVLKQENHSRLQAAKAALQGELESAYCGKLFDKHRGWATFGMLAIAAAVVGLSLFAAFVRLPADPGGAIRLPLIALAMFGLAWWLHHLRAEGSAMTMLARISAFAAAGIGLFAAFPAVTGALSGGAWPVLLPLAAAPIALSAYSWLYAPTREGRIVMDHIAGFRRYLGITEEDRLDALHPPEKTPELFERYLPYAIALDVQNRWAERFAGVLATAAAAGATGHAVGWYSGSGDIWSDPGGFADSVGSSLASTISSASASPSSGGGSSGSGSSGGGGGGGGGSGW